VGATDHQPSLLTHWNGSFTDYGTSRSRFNFGTLTELFAELLNDKKTDSIGTGLHYSLVDIHSTPQFCTAEHHQITSQPTSDS